MSAPDEYKRGTVAKGRADSGGSQLADKALQDVKQAIKPAPLPPPKKANEK